MKSLRYILPLAVVGLLLLFNRAESPATVKIEQVQPDRIYYAEAMGKTLALPDGKQAPIRSLLNVQKTLAFGDYVWNEKDIPKGEVWILVDLSRQTMSVFRGGHEIGTSLIVFGIDEFKTPTGIFNISEMKKEHQSTIYVADMPYMMRLTNDGITIHASDVRKGYASHGCIGIPIEFAKLVFEQIHRGDMVAVTNL